MKNLKNRKKLILICVLGMIAMMCFNSFLTSRLFAGAEAEEVSYDEFLKQLEDKNVDRVQVEDSEIYFTLKNDTEDETNEYRGLQISYTGNIQGFADKLMGEKEKYYYTTRISDIKLVDRLYESGAVFSQVEQEENSILSMLFSLLFSIGIPVLLFIFMMRYLAK